ncbi:MAG: aromatic amino acid hydroxylase [Bacteriovoracaceae bacterium]|nr:aromatic amino acid hydroxylase [Bacteriovoracaceae bacterium]
MNLPVIPKHLQKYIVDHNYARYTAIDQAVWRFIMRQLKSYLRHHAHPDYLLGLEETGISIEEIPRIENIDKKLQKFGWRAIPISGFIPPTAFMELQSLHILPIAADIRTIEHLTYTPAPDIVHEAAGHAPLLVVKEFRDYLEDYAEMAAKAVISQEDVELYEVIRELSDLKEQAGIEAKIIEDCELRLEQAVEKMTYHSEAALLTRMAWWTSEYGLIGSPEQPLIYGAGLLSSIGESYACLEQNSRTKKIPFSLDCLNFSYDITEQQPQLFVTPDFATLRSELKKFSQTMCYQRGGLLSLEKIKQAGTVSTVELNSGIQISGILNHIEVQEKEAIYLNFTSACQLSYASQELAGQGKSNHPQGFGCPVGLLKNTRDCLSSWSIEKLEREGWIKGENISLEFASGVKVQGVLLDIVRMEEKNILVTFKDCKVLLGEKVLFEPAWGLYDMAVGSSIPSVFGGAADRDAYGDIKDFIVSRVQMKVLNSEDKKLEILYAEVRRMREKKQVLSAQRLEEISQILQKEYSQDWLLSLEILELSSKLPTSFLWVENIKKSLQKRAQENKNLQQPILQALKNFNIP